MISFTNLKTKRYLGRIMLLITISIIVTIIVFSSIVYYTTEKIFLKNEYETSNKILNQVKYNIDLMDKTVKNLCMNLYVNSDIREIMYSSEENDYTDFITKINRLASSIIATNSYIHSVCIYNGRTKLYYNIGQNMDYIDKELKELVKNSKDIPKLKPVSRKIFDEYGSNKSYKTVFTYFMYDSPGNFQKVEGAIIVNVKSEWILENLKQINSVGSNKIDNIFVLNDKYEFIDDESGDIEFKKQLGKNYLDEIHRIGTGKKSGFFETGLKGVKYVITYVNVENEGLTLLKVEPVNEVYKYIIDFKLTAIAVTVLFLVIALFTAVSISIRIYKPIGNLVKNISGNNHQANDLTYKDEISYIGTVVKDSMEKLKTYNSEKYHLKNIVKDYWLKKLLTESYAFKEGQFEAMCAENRIKMSFDGSYVICIAKIDSFKAFQANNSVADRNLIKFAAINILKELISSKYSVEGVDMEKDHVALLIEIGGDSEDFCVDLKESVKQAQSYILEYYRVSVTVSFGERVTGIRNVTRGYDSAMENSLYRLAHGKAAVITPKPADAFYSTPNELHQRKIEEKLSASIKSGNLNGVKDSISQACLNMKSYSYGDMVISMIQLVQSVKKTIEDIDKFRVKSISKNVGEINHRIFEMETLDEFSESMLAFIENILEEAPEIESDARNKVIVQAAIDYIERNYSDTGLCGNQIAEVLKIHPRSITKMFKEAMGISISDYINNLRMDVVSKLLEESKYTVYEIMERAGIQNESNFYRSFKARYGATPKEYALMKNIKSRLEK